MSKKSESTEAVSRSHKGISYPLSVKVAAVRDYLKGMPRSQVALKYSLRDPTIISHWKSKFVGKETIQIAMKRITRPRKAPLQTDAESELLSQIRDLERSLSACQKELCQKNKELRKVQLHLDLSEAMIDIAEEQYSIDIRKKSGSKQ